MNDQKQILVSALKSTNSLYCTTGRKNAYRDAFHTGLGASRGDETFDPKLGVRGGHRCCGSKVEWRHKVTCSNAVRNAPDDYSDLKNID